MNAPLQQKIDKILKRTLVNYPILIVSLVECFLLLISGIWNSPEPGADSWSTEFTIFYFTHLPIVLSLMVIRELLEVNGGPYGWGMTFQISVGLIAILQVIMLTLIYRFLLEDHVHKNMVQTESKLAVAPRKAA